MESVVAYDHKIHDFLVFWHSYFEKQQIWLFFFVKFNYFISLYFLIKLHMTPYRKSNYTQNLKKNATVKPNFI